MAEEGTIGRRYARALSMTIVGDAAVSQTNAPAKLDERIRQELLQVEGELTVLADEMEKRGDFRQAMLNPQFVALDRRAILTAVTKAHGFLATTSSFVVLLVEKDRFAYISAIANAFHDEVDERIGRVRAEITSAKALSEPALREIVRALEIRTSRHVVADVRVDASVISGVRARIGGQVFDATMSAQLARLRAHFATTPSA